MLMILPTNPSFANAANVVTAMPARSRTGRAYPAGAVPALAARCAHSV